MQEQRNSAYPGLQTLIDMLPYIDDVGITATDVRLRDAVLGGPIETFKGKSTLPPQLPSHPPLAPRVTQVQQVLIVDIMFLLGMPFLLGLLDPLGMLLVKRLRDRSAANVVYVLTEFIATAKSRNFNVQVVSCDGEKGVGALTTRLMLSLL